MLRFKKSFNFLNIRKNNYSYLAGFNLYKNYSKKFSLAGPYDSQRVKVKSDQESSDFESDDVKEPVNLKNTLVIAEEESDDFEIEIQVEPLKRNKVKEEKIILRDSINSDQGDLHSHFIIDRNFRCKYKEYISIFLTFLEVDKYYKLVLLKLFL